MHRRWSTYPGTKKMQTELLVSTIEEALSRETLYYLAQYDSPQTAWQLSRDPTWMIQLCDKAETTSQHKQAVVRLGCRIIEQTPISDTKTVYSLIKNKSVADLFFRIRQYADGEIARRDLIGSHLTEIVEKKLPTFERQYTEEPARIEVIHAVLALAERDTWMVRFYTRIIHAVKAANPALDYSAYTRANMAIADTIRLVFTDLWLQP